MRTLIVVTGATGNVGGALVTALAAEGVPVRALIRQDEARVPGSGTGVETVVGDMDQPATLGPVFDGAEAAFLLPGFRDMPGVLEAARAAGVTHVVQLSGGSAASGDSSNAVTAYMVRSEEAVRASGLSHTIIRPSAFMSNAFRWLPQLRSGNEVRVQFPAVRTACLDPADLAAVASVALRERRWAGEVLEPTGPEALTAVEQVRILARTTGRDLVPVELTDDETRAQMERDGTPKQYIDAFFDFYVTGTLDESVVRPTVAEVTGRAPGTFSAWAAAHAEAFR